MLLGWLYVIPICLPKQSRFLQSGRFHSVKNSSAIRLVVQYGAAGHAATVVQMPYSEKKNELVGNAGLTPPFSRLILSFSSHTPSCVIGLFSFH